MKPIVVRSALETAGKGSGAITDAVRQQVSAGRPMYEIALGVLKEARPDLVLTQALCEVCAVPTSQVDEAMDSLPQKPMVVSLDPHSLEDMLNNILMVAEAAGVKGEGERVIGRLRARRDAVVSRAGMASRRPRVVCLEWLEPLLVAGHWGPEMAALAGGEDCFGKAGEPSRRVSWEEVVEARPEVVMAMPCGMDVPTALAEVHLLTEKPGWGDLPAIKNNAFFVADGSAYFSRSGPRLIDGLELLAEAFHPELFKGVAPSGGVFRVYGRLFRLS
jgi:iron complex transport system substrate-binding protein